MDGGEWKKVANSSKCNRFEGLYSFDKKNGLGTFTWESGNIYNGNYVNDERNGYGEMYWTDGSVYKGEWHKGIQHGRGVMTSQMEELKMVILKIMYLKATHKFKRDH